MWEIAREAAPGGERVSLFDGTAAVSFGDALKSMRRDAGFRAFLLENLRSARFAAFYWETPPITLEGTARPFEYVTLSAPGLAAATPDPRPFAEHLARAGPDETVTSFANLGGDAVLIAPRCVESRDCYGHLAAFLRLAPAAQQHDLLARTASQAQAVLSDRPLWISTCGAAVPWLHVRLDNRPKYYSHTPYRRWPS